MQIFFQQVALMKKNITNLLDITFWKFILVGVVNTLIGSLIMFTLYNFAHCNYWISSFANYFFGSILSYFLNKNFTFQNKNKDYKIVLKFICNISKPASKMLLSSTPITIQENISLLIGMGLFVILNYIGQRFFTFKKE